MEIPRGCRWEEFAVANCSDAEFDIIPRGYYNNTKIIDLSTNQITVLKKNIFVYSNITELSALDLSHNFISEIDKNAFFYEKALHEIDLSYNIISRFDPRIIQYNTKLERLSLRGNIYLNLTHLGGFLFSENLRQIDISYCNLQIIPANTFVRLPNLEHVDLSLNSLRILETQSFAGIKQLTFLDLSKNSLPCIMWDMLKNIVNNTGQGNKREAAKCNVNLANNPWTCHCQMKKVCYLCKCDPYDANSSCSKYGDVKVNQNKTMRERDPDSHLQNEKVEDSGGRHEEMQTSIVWNLSIILFIVFWIQLTLNAIWMKHINKAIPQRMDDTLEIGEFQAHDVTSQSLGEELHVLNT